jgi:membrane-associated phospholipid phosphatase
MTRTMIALFVIGVGLLLYALLGIAWMARREGVKIWAWEAAPACTVAWRKRLSSVSLLLFGAGLLLGWATPLSPVQSVDRIVGQQLYRRGGHSVAMTLKTLVRLGDPNPLVYSGLLVVLTRVVRGRAHALRLFAYTTIGAYGLELCGKLLFPQVRTSLLLGQALSNYPSGTAMRAMVLALVLLVIWGPARRRSWPHVWLRRAVVGWPILTSTAIVALRWHALSEAIGGLLLGAAWVGLCLRLLLRYGEAGREPRMPKGECHA